MIVIPLTPYPAPRPRFSKFGTYNPKKYTEHKKAFALLAKVQSKTYFERGIELNVTFFMPIPTSLSKKKRSELIEQHYHIKKPDCDNLLKTVKDSLEGVFYKNDSQICKVTMQKVYSDKPRVEFKLRSI